MIKKHFSKKIKNPFYGELGGPDITVYADLPSASFFHNAYLLPILEGIKSFSKEDIHNEDNEIEMYVRLAGPSLFRITYKLNEQDEAKAIMLEYDADHNFKMFYDPLA